MTHRLWVFATMASLSLVERADAQPLFIPDEEPAVDVVNKMGAEYFVVSSDYPHSDGAFPEAIQQFLGLPLNDEQRRKILWDNCAKLYGIAKPAGSLTRDLKAA